MATGADEVFLRRRRGAAIVSVSVSCRPSQVADDARHHVTLDEFLLPSCRRAQRGGGHAVYLAQA
ncbi:hypothetical protein [Sorangium sp. So ce426]|uniref:hypothetical protein n=1 Tax=unclassified Sorangium TaxID=2621164 RepID=UPI003F5B9D72